MKRIPAIQKLRQCGELLAIASVTVLASQAISVANPPESTIAAPRMRSYSWMSWSEWFIHHAEDVALAENSESQIIFWGDSITQSWSETRVWKETFEPLEVLNFGIGGDMTQNLLWRLENGAVGTLNPEKVVLLIGTNNMEYAPKEISEGVIAVVRALKNAYPKADILLMAIFPREINPDHPYRIKIREVNRTLQPLGESERITYLDIGEQFLRPDGTLPQELMPDFLHLSEQGYEIWAQAILHWLNSFKN